MTFDGQFPPLQRVATYNQWHGTIALPSLARCYVKWAWSSNNFFPSSRAEQTKGPAHFCVDDEDGNGPDAPQHAAVGYLAENESLVATILIEKLKAPAQK